MPRTQAERKAETRERLLAAAAELFAARGVDGVPVDRVAADAGRTSGAIYAHFGSKDGLLTALLDSYKDHVAAVTAAEFATSSDRDGRLAALWRNFVDPPDPHGDRWLLLELELWLAAMRRPELRPALAARYRDAQDRLAGVLGPDAGGVAVLLIGLLVGVEVQRRLDPDRIDDDQVRRALAALARLAPDDERGRNAHAAQ